MAAAARCSGSRRRGRPRGARSTGTAEGRACPRCYRGRTGSAPCATGAGAVISRPRRRSFPPTSDASFVSRPPSRAGAGLVERGEHLRRMALRPPLLPRPAAASLRVDEERAAGGAHVRPPVVLLLDPAALRLPHGMILVRHESEA